MKIKPENKGKQIKTLDALVKAVEDKRAVFTDSFGMLHNPRPAAWVINLSGAIISRIIINGLYIYKKDKK